MTLTRGFARNAATTPLDTRLMDMATVVCNADGSPRAGVIGGHAPAIVAATATMNVTVAAAEFITTKGKSDGVMRFTNDGTVNVLIGNAPASNSRIDVIYVKHNDNTTGDATSTPVFGVQAGTAAASPVKPAIPTGALELATIRVYSGSTATNNGGNVLTNTYAMTAARGGTVPFRDATERAAWANPVLGQKAFQINDQRTYTWLVTSAAPGGEWVPERPAFLVRKANAQSLSTGWQVIAAAYGAPDFNDLGTWSAGALTIARTGLYRINFNIAATTSTDPFAAQIVRNATAPDGTTSLVSSLGKGSSMSISAVVNLVAGDVLRTLVYSNTTNSIEAVGDRGATFNVELIRVG